MKQWPFVYLIWGIAALLFEFRIACMIAFVCALTMLYTLHCIQIGLLQFICKLLHLPFVFRIVKQTYLEPGETDRIHYEPSAYNPWRFDVEVDIDGLITKWVRRG